MEKLAISEQPAKTMAQVLQYSFDFSNQRSVCSDAGLVSGVAGVIFD